MVSRSYRCLLIVIIAFSVTNSVIANSVLLNTQDSSNSQSLSIVEKNSSDLDFPVIEFQLSKAIAQNDTTNTTTTTTTTTTTISDETTNETDTRIHSPWESPTSHHFRA